MTNLNCNFIDCTQEKSYKGDKYCDYHLKGSVLGNGKAYDQYQLIEQDFIDFIKVVPIDEPKHMKVHSPVLRDIIIRSCVEIELFFKEWSKYECSENENSKLLKEYNKIKNGEKEAGKERNWSFRSYFILKHNFSKNDAVYVRPMGKRVQPFEEWTAKKVPTWWSAYNSIKHGGITSIKEANLSNALNCLAALFQMHCINRYSKDYLLQYCGIQMSGYSDLRLKIGTISSPVDSKRFLFQEGVSEREIELVSKRLFKNRNKKSFTR